MKKSFLIAAIVVTAVLLGIFHYKLKRVPDDKDLQRSAHSIRGQIEWQNKTAPDFELTTLNGEKFRLADNVGQKTIVLNFFATWCAPCRAEMPELSRYAQEHEAERFMILFIDIDESSEKVSDFLRELKVDFPAGIDHGPIQKQYAVEAYPTTVVIGVDGKLLSYETGQIVNAEVAFDESLKKDQELLKAGKAISRDEYLAEAQNQKQLPVTAPRTYAEEEKEKEINLDERGKRIAAKMPCPCGCPDKVAKCTCSTSTNIKKALASEDFGNKPDNEIMESLNKRFCMGSM